MNILVRDPKSGRNIQVTKKAFESIYSDRGFVELTRDNADVASPAKAARAKTTDSGELGSAADIAKTIGLETDGSDVNTSEPVIDGERNSNRAPRSRGSN